MAGALAILISGATGIAVPSASSPSTAVAPRVSAPEHFSEEVAVLSTSRIGSIATLTHAARSATEREPNARIKAFSAGASREQLASRSVTPCPDARRGLAYYQARARYWGRKRLGAGGVMPVSRMRDSHRLACPQIHRAVRFWRARARAARLRYERWSYSYEWRSWLPAKFYRVARCETGVDWHFDSGTYVSAFGIIRAAFPTWNGRNSPREQYEVAAAIQRRYSWSAWGCGGA